MTSTRAHASQRRYIVSTNRISKDQPSRVRLNAFALRHHQFRSAETLWEGSGWNCALNPRWHDHSVLETDDFRIFHFGSPHVRTEVLRRSRSPRHLSRRTRWTALTYDRTARITVNAAHERRTGKTLYSQRTDTDKVSGRALLYIQTLTTLIFFSCCVGESPSGVCVDHQIFSRRRVGIGSASARRWMALFLCRSASNAS